MPDPRELYEKIQDIDGYDDDLSWVFNPPGEVNEELVLSNPDVSVIGSTSEKYTLIIPWDSGREKEIAIEVGRILSVLDYYVYIHMSEDFNVLVLNDPMESLDTEVLNVDNDGVVLVSKPDTGFISKNLVSREI